MSSSRALPARLPGRKLKRTPGSSDTRIWRSINTYGRRKPMDVWQHSASQGGSQQKQLRAPHSTNSVADNNTECDAPLEPNLAVSTEVEEEVIGKWNAINTRHTQGLLLRLRKPLPDRPTTQEGEAEPQGGDAEKQAVPPRSSSVSIKQNSSTVTDEPPTETADDEDVRDNSAEFVLETSRRKQQITLTNIKHNSSSTADELSTEISDINDKSDDFVEFVRETTIRKRRLDTGVELEVIEDRPLQTRSSNCHHSKKKKNKDRPLKRRGKNGRRVDQEDLSQYVKLTTPTSRLSSGGVLGPEALRPAVIGDGFDGAEVRPTGRPMKVPTRRSPWKTKSKPAPKQKTIHQFFGCLPLVRDREFGPSTIRSGDNRPSLDQNVPDSHVIMVSCEDEATESALSICDTNYQAVGTNSEGASAPYGAPSTEVILSSPSKRSNDFRTTVRPKQIQGNPGEQLTIAIYPGGLVRCNEPLRDTASAPRQGESINIVTGSRLESISVPENSEKTALTILPGGRVTYKQSRPSNTAPADAVSEAVNEPSISVTTLQSFKEATTSIIGKSNVEVVVNTDGHIAEDLDDGPLTDHAGASVTLDLPKMSVAGIEIIDDDEPCDQEEGGIDAAMMGLEVDSKFSNLVHQQAHVFTEETVRLETASVHHRSPQPKPKQVSATLDVVDEGQRSHIKVRRQVTWSQRVEVMKQKKPRRGMIQEQEQSENDNDRSEFFSRSEKSSEDGIDNDEEDDDEEENMTEVDEKTDRSSESREIASDDSMNEDDVDSRSDASNLTTSDNQVVDAESDEDSASLASVMLPDPLRTECERGIQRTVTLFELRQSQSQRPASQRPRSEISIFELEGDWERSFEPLTAGDDMLMDHEAEDPESQVVIKQADIAHDFDDEDLASHMSGVTENLLEAVEDEGVSFEPRAAKQILQRVDNQFPETTRDGNIHPTRRMPSPELGDDARPYSQASTIPDSQSPHFQEHSELTGDEHYEIGGIEWPTYFNEASATLSKSNISKIIIPRSRSLPAYKQQYVTYDEEDAPENYLVLSDHFSASAARRTLSQGNRRKSLDVLIVETRNTNRTVHNVRRTSSGLPAFKPPSKKI